MKTTIKQNWSIIGVIAYLILLIVLPLGTIFDKAFANGWGGFVSELTNPLALSALWLTLITSLLCALINTVMGTLIAYVLVRLPLPGKTIINTLVDMPFAIPTTVSGLMLLILYSPASPIGGWLWQQGIHLTYSVIGIMLAMTFITMPYTIRATMPLLEEIEPAMEEAAQTLGASPSLIVRKIILPAILPGILTGLTLTFTRSLAEFGSVVLVSGNLPMRTQVSSVYIYGLVENNDPTGASVISVVLLLISFLGLAYQAFVLRKSLRQWRLSNFSWSKRRIERRNLHEAQDVAL
jgi:sulfate transport system permease protein